VSELLIGTYTSPSMDGHGAGVMSAVLAGDRLEAVTPAIETPDPSYLVLSSVGEIYAVDETGNRLVAFDAAGRALGAAPTGGEAPCHLALSPDERFVLVAHYGSGSVSVHERHADGSLGRRCDYVEHGAGAHAHMIAFDPVDGTVLVPDLGLDAVVAYRLDDTGRLHERYRLALQSGTGPRHVVFVADHLYVLGELGSTVTAFERTAAGWQPIAEVSTIPSDWTARNQAAAIRAHGDRLFVSNRGHDSVALFVIDPVPRLLDRVRCAGREPRDLLVTSDGSRVLVANQLSDEVAVFSVEGERLRFASSAAVGSPVCLVAR
jgi:6-phosphogluconolactonase